MHLNPSGGRVGTRWAFRTLNGALESCKRPPAQAVVHLRQILIAYEHLRVRKGTCLVPFTFELLAYNLANLVKGLRGGLVLKESKLRRILTAKFETRGALVIVPLIVV